MVAPPARRVLGTCPPHRRRVAAGGRGTPPRLFVRRRNAIAFPEGWRRSLSGGGRGPPILDLRRNLAAYPHWPQDRFCRVGGFGRVGGRVLGRSAVAHGVLCRGRERGRLARREAGAGDGVAPPLFGNDQGTLAGNIGMIAKSGKGGFQGSLVGFDAAAGKQPVVPI